MKHFNESILDERVVSALTALQFTNPTPIQKEAIPYILQGEDVIGQAQTGTGKTGAFGIPIVHQIDVQNEHIQALILCPTRELAHQVGEQLNAFGKDKKVRTVVIFGGEPMPKQIRSLKRRAHIVVATPGRLIDHMRRRTIRLQHVQTVVLDEADEMLNMGFIEEIETILQAVPDERQTLLFSATMPQRIKRLADQFMHNPKLISVAAQNVTVDHIQQRYIELRERDKFEALCRLLHMDERQVAIIFGRTKRRVAELTEALRQRGFAVEGIHGDLTQAQRNDGLRQFREQKVQLLVATDVAARGLDISDVSHVYNFDLPQDPESYVHRIGRTGRAGKSGMAITFVTRAEREHMRTIERLIQKKITPQPLPTKEEVHDVQQQAVIYQLQKQIAAGSGQYTKQATTLLQEGDPVTVVSAALQLLTKEMDDTPVQLTAEPPLRRRKKKGKQTNRPPRRRRRRRSANRS